MIRSPRSRPVQLEILKSLPSGEPKRSPLLFVHGAFAAAWCWAEFFLPYFARAGHPAYAVSLRGHGASDGHDELPLSGIVDYMEDVRVAAESLPGKPVLIGHSMGGLIVQRCLHTIDAAGAVLMASVPPEGLFSPSMDLMLRDPSLFHEMQLLNHGGHPYLQFGQARRAVFSPSMPEERARKYLYLMQRESYQAIIDMTWFPGSPLRDARGLPVLVVGGEDDMLFPPRFIHATARAYGTEAMLIPDMAHTMMLEIEWREAAEQILGWLRENDL